MEKILAVVLVLFSVALGWFIIPFLQWIDYKKDKKKYGKEIADEQARHFR